MTIDLYPGDNRQNLRRLIDQGMRVHSVVTDPPYGLVSIQKRFGKEGAAPAQFGTDGAFTRASKGFMGKIWDGTGIERDPDFWRLIWEVLLPGGYVFAFSGSRTGHWQACAMELAGFIMHPMHGWVAGSGFPKAHNASKVIDKMLGTTDLRQVLDVKYEAKRFAPGATVVREGGYRKRTDEDGNEQTFEATNDRGGSPEAQQWDGWAYGTQAQKPALEPIYLGQKPFSEKTGAANLLKHGVGAVNIDGCRVPTNGDSLGGGRTGGSVKASNDGWNRPYMDDPDYMAQLAKDSKDRVAKAEASGRHPANLILDGSPEVVAMFPTSSVTGKRSAQSKAASVQGTNWLMDNHESKEYTDSGSAARFFHQYPPSLADMAPLIYNPKAGKADRAGGNHPTVKPVALMQYLIRHITPPGGTVLDPFAGSGTTAEAARREGFDCILMEAEPEYVTFLRKRFGIYDFDDILGNSTENSVDRLLGDLL